LAGVFEALAGDEFDIGHWILDRFGRDPILLDALFEGAFFEVLPSFDVSVWHEEMIPFLEKEFDLPAYAAQGNKPRNSELAIAIFFGIELDEEARWQLGFEERQEKKARKIVWSDWFGAYSKNEAFDPAVADWFTSVFPVKIDPRWDFEAIENSSAPDELTRWLARKLPSAPEWKAVRRAFVNRLVNAIESAQIGARRLKWQPTNDFPLVSAVVRRTNFSALPAREAGHSAGVSALEERLQQALSQALLLKEVGKLRRADLNDKIAAVCKEKATAPEEVVKRSCVEPHKIAKFLVFGNQRNRISS
jgi:hypothetical protein